MTTSRPPCLFILLSTLPVAASAYNCSDLVPAGLSWERNLSVMATGPVTCAAASAHDKWGTYYVDTKEAGSGGPVYASGAGGMGLTVSASAALGSSHANATTGAPAVLGDASALWTDVMTVTGPISQTPVTVSFFGHLDGRLSKWDGVSDVAPAAVVNYWLQIGTASFHLKADAFSVQTGQWTGDPSFEPMTGVSRLSSGPASNETISQNFRIDVDFLFVDATSQSFGSYGYLVAGAGPGATADFGNTASLDWMVLPSGYGISAHGLALAPDAQGRFLYAAVVPEPASAALLLAGLLGLGLRRLRGGSAAQV
jgi:hypothetical protein